MVLLLELDTHAWPKKMPKKFIKTVEENRIY
jgi:hypothetical protein